MARNQPCPPHCKQDAHLDARSLLVNAMAGFEIWQSLTVSRDADKSASLRMMETTMCMKVVKPRKPDAAIFQI